MPLVMEFLVDIEMEKEINKVCLLTS